MFQPILSRQWTRIVAVLCLFAGLSGVLSAAGNPFLKPVSAQKPVVDVTTPPPPEIAPEPEPPAPGLPLDAQQIGAMNHLMIYRSKATGEIHYVAPIDGELLE